MHIKLCRIPPEVGRHVHLLTQCIIADRINFKTERTLENVRSDGGNNCSTHTERTLSRVRFNPYNVRSARKRQYNISELMQSIKGNFSRKIHHGNIWQKRFYTRIADDEEYLANIIEYIKQNPIKAELPDKYRHWPYQYFNFEKIQTLF